MCHKTSARRPVRGCPIVQTEDRTVTLRASPMRQQEQRDLAG